MTGKQLKNSILQWAIQGKLVPQDPNDEPASVLLEKIRAEKARLVKEGKLKKKDLEVKPIAEDEIPFEIPKGWEWVRWGDLSESIQYGYNAPAKETGRIKMVRISDIQNGRIVWETTPFCNIEEKEIDTYLLKKNDILFARTGGTVGKSYLVSEEPEEAIYAGYLIRTRYSSLLCAQYLKAFMESSLYWAQLKDGTIATAQPNCNGQTLSKMMLPLPPLSEQHRIVAKIEELMPFVEKYGAAQETLDERNQALPEKLKKSILQEAIFGNHIGIQISDINEVRMKEACDIIMGQSPEGNTYNTSNGIEFHQGKVAFGNMFLNPSGVFTTSPTKYAEPDSIVVSVRAPVGTANITKRRICIGRGLACIKPKPNADLMYIYYLLESPEIRECLEDNATGTTFKAISGKVLQELEIPLPPLTDQRRIVSKIEELFGVIEK